MPGDAAGGQPLKTSSRAAAPQAPQGLSQKGGSGRRPAERGPRTHLSRIRAGRCGESSFSLAETAGDQGRKAERRWRGWTQPRLCRESRKSAPQKPQLLLSLRPARRPPPGDRQGSWRSTLLEEAAKVRSQLDCLSFSGDVGGCEEEASGLGLMEAGGSEDTCSQHKRPRWCRWAWAPVSLQPHEGQPPARAPRLQAMRSAVGTRARGVQGTHRQPSSQLPRPGGCWASCGKAVVTPTGTEQRCAARRV